MLVLFIVLFSATIGTTTTQHAPNCKQLSIGCIEQPQCIRPQYSIRGRSTINEPTPSTQSLYQRRLDKGKPVSSTQPQLNGCSTSTCVLGHQHDGNEGKGTVNKMMGKMEDKDNNMKTRGTAGRSVYIHNCY